jgi:hypothetical protein
MIIRRFGDGTVEGEVRILAMTVRLSCITQQFERTGDGGKDCLVVNGGQKPRNSGDMSISAARQSR